MLDWLSGQGKLRTLMVLKANHLHINLELDQLRSIRTLSVAGSGFEEDKLRAIGKLIHLRYLD